MGIIQTPDYTAIVGDESPELPEPLTTETEAQVYFEECILKPQVRLVEMKQPGLTMDARVKLARAHIMLWGRAIAVNDVCFRMGLLSRDQFRENHVRLTDNIATEAQISSVQDIRTLEHARGYMDTHLLHLEVRREAAIRATVIEEQQAHFRAFLSRMGQVLEANGLFVRQALYDAGPYEHYFNTAMGFSVPTVSE